jgi:hypothetical protein
MAKQMAADDPATYLIKNDQFMQLDHQQLNHFDLKKPETQKGLSDLAVMDAITGQVDRHGGNIHINQNTGQVKGIDNDLAFGLNDKHEAEGHRVGLPNQIAASTAESVLGLKGKDLKQILNGGSKGKDEKLNKAEIEAAKARLKGMQDHIRELKKNDQLVTDWNDNTYNAALADPGQNYLKRHEMARQNPMGSERVEPAPQPPPPPVVAAPAPAVANHQWQAPQRRQRWRPARPAGLSDSDSDSE